MLFQQFALAATPENAISSQLRRDARKIAGGRARRPAERDRATPPEHGLKKRKASRRDARKTPGRAKRQEQRAIFVHGFAKKDLGNISPRELKALRKLAKIVLAYLEAQLASSMASGALIEIRHNGETVP